MDPSSETMELHDNKNEKEVTKRCVACEEYTFYFSLPHPTPHQVPRFVLMCRAPSLKKMAGVSSIVLRQKKPG